MTTQEAPMYKFSVRMNWESEQRNPYSLLFDDDPKKNEKRVFDFDFNGKTVELTVFNRAKEERFRTQNNNIYRGFNGFLTVLYADERVSIEQALYHNSEIIRYTHDEIFVITLLLKDESTPSQVSDQEMSTLKNGSGDNFHFVEIQPNNTEVLESVVKGIAEQLLGLQESDQKEQQNEVEEEGEQKHKKKNKKGKTKKGDKNCVVV